MAAKKKTKKTFTANLGNLEVRRGHRSDCAQISAVAKVKAHFELNALEAIRETLHDGEVFVIEVYSGFTVEITFNASTVSKVTEVEDE